MQMVITYFGEQFVKITQGDFVMAINPVSKNAKGGSIGRFGSALTLLSTHHPSMNGIAEVTYGDNVPFVVDGPGEYEVGGVSIVGIGNPVEIEGKEYTNTSYYFHIDDIAVCFLGAIANEKAVESIREKTGEIDVLFVPLGGHLSSAQASKVAVMLEPSITIPVAHAGKGDKNLASFLKESESHEEVDKLTLKKKDCAERDGDTIVITPGNNA